MAKYNIGDCFAYKGFGKQISWIGKIVDVWLTNKYGEPYEYPIYVLRMLITSRDNGYSMSKNAWSEKSIDEDCTSYPQEQFVKIEEIYDRMVSEINKLI